MNRQPTLAGDNLGVRPLAEADRESLYLVARDPQVWALHPMHDRWQRPVFDAMFDDAMANGGALAVIDRATGVVIGSSQFRPSEAETGAIEIGWTYLARSHWGGAANRELKRLMVGHALDQVEACVFRVGETNLRSRRAMEKIGGQLQDRRQVVDHPDGRRIAHVFYRIDRASFAEGLGRSAP